MTRSNWQVTVAVWRALLLREAVSRLFGRRAALFWLLLEPVAHMAFFVFVFKGYPLSSSDTLMLDK
jgi:capsular polysaccharide transport system permease protein